MVTVTISAASRAPLLAKGFPITISLPEKTVEDVTVADVKAAVAAKIPQLYVSRQKLTQKGDRKALKDELTLKAAGVVDGEELQVKDLGPQLSWRAVFIVEYIGPLIVHPLVYHFPNIFYGGSVRHSALQKYVYALVMLHFLKRECETIFLHRFSKATMPASYIFRNSAHYHLLAGVLLAYAMYGPGYAASSASIKGTIRDNNTFLMSCTAVWLFAEISNFWTHLTLRNLRPEGTTVRAIPRGYGFSLVSFPNYTFEIIGWIAVAFMTGSYAAWLFVVVGSATMCKWAVEKHGKYRKEFGKEYPRGRKAIIPFIL